MPIDRLVIDSSEAVTELCELGREYNADKSPYNLKGHRHPYTSVYTMLFSSLKNRPINFAEIGVAGGASACVWSGYFTHPETRIRMFDHDEMFLANCREGVGEGSGEPRLTADLMDVSVDGDVVRALGDMEYDVILDDSSHEFGHQIRIIHEAFPKLKRGGVLIVEDVFRSIAEEEYAEALKDVLPSCAAAYFVLCEHKWRWSPGWDNDKLLVLVKA
jgi:predicted O-methyltransferase YrrM